MAGRPAGLSEDEAEEFEDDFFPTNNSVTSIAEPVIRSRLNSRSPALSNAKQVHIQRNRKTLTYRREMDWKSRIYHPRAYLWYI